MSLALMGMPASLERCPYLISELAEHLVDRYGDTAHEFLFEVGMIRRDKR